MIVSGEQLGNFFPHAVDAQCDDEAHIKELCDWLFENYGLEAADGSYGFDTDREWAWNYAGDRHYSYRFYFKSASAATAFKLKL